MKVGILTIGNELTSGKTQDTNSSYIARELVQRGWQMAGTLSVGDDDEAIKDGLDYILSRADAVIVTGGLGPTVDDITTAAIARAYNRKLFTDEATLNHIKERFERAKLNWTNNNAKQAEFPEGAEVIPNPAGTAAGFALKVGDKLITVIPGVPMEARRMLTEGVIPVLIKAFPEEPHHLERRIIKTFGLAEAAVDQKVADIDLASLGVGIGFYPNFPEIQVVLTIRDADEAKAKKNLKQAEDQVVSRLKDHIFGYDQDTLEGVCAALLTEKKRTLAVAESLTGGFLTDRLTDIPGSSVYLERGVVTYSNASKTDLLGVPAEIINEFGAVSAETARLMAEGVRKLGKTDIGISTTGIAGPTGGTEKKPVGTVFIALADKDKTYCRQYGYRWDRRRIKMITTQALLLMLKRYLTGELTDE
ncbi:MAG: competence/damage-inducible protein A [Deltaproteobacteria bacterium]|nr:competence/damage-inducible protein A [Deltaproteobacteria bacterium]